MSTGFAVDLMRRLAAGHMQNKFNSNAVQTPSQTSLHLSSKAADLGLDNNQRHCYSHVPQYQTLHHIRVMRVISGNCAAHQRHESVSSRGQQAVHLDNGGAEDRGEDMYTSDILCMRDMC